MPKSTTAMEARGEGPMWTEVYGVGENDQTSQSSTCQYGSAS